MAETLNPLALRQWRAEWQVRAESREERAAGNGMRTFFIFLEPRPRPPQLFRQLSTLNKTNRAASASRSTTPTVPERPGRPPRAKGLPRQPSGPTRCCRKREGFFVFRFFRFSRPLSLFSSASLPLSPPPSLSLTSPLSFSLTTHSSPAPYPLCSWAPCDLSPASSSREPRWPWGGGPRGPGSAWPPPPRPLPPPRPCSRAPRPPWRRGSPRPSPSPCSLPWVCWRSRAAFGGPRSRTGRS